MTAWINFCALHRTLGLISRHSITGPDAGRQPRTICIFKQYRRERCRSKKNSVKRIDFLSANATDHIRISSGQGLGREIILIEGSDPGKVSSAARESIEALRTDTGQHEEPMINIIGHYSNGKFLVAVFPRRAHRPAAFFREDDRRIMISPAVMEMGGIMVTPSEADFNRLDAPTIESIYREVSLIKE